MNRAEPRRRNPRGEGIRLREELLRAAGRLLESSPSADSLSLRAVAREAGVAAPSIYAHFADKNELLLALLAQLFADFANELDRVTDPDEDDVTQLRARALGYCEFADRYPGHYHVMFTTWLPKDPGGDLPGAGIVEDLTARIARCQGPEGARETAAVLWSSLHGLVTLRQSKPAFPWPPRETLVERLLSALGLEGGPTPAVSTST